MKVNSTEAIKAAWDSRVESYMKMLSDPKSRGLAAEIELAAFKRALPPVRKLDILDAGCGVGFHGNRLLAEGHRVTFIDVSPRMLERAQEDARRIVGAKVTFLECDIRNMPDVPNCSFDAILSGGTVISDCGNPSQAMSELVRVLRQNGTLGFSVRNLNGPQQKENSKEIIPEGGPGFDWWFFSIESVTNLCKVAGVVSMRVYPVLMEPPIPGNIEEGVRDHLSVQDDKQWRKRAWEMFIIANKPYNK